jgi:3-hydroxy-9,10-secoandrosta-1,3,5(10)-triene-9,17-dione monooxygenase
MNIPSADTLVERARALIPLLRERAASVEAERRVSDDTIARFTDAGFFRTLQPRRWGGYEMNPSVFYKVLMELGRGCPSSAWNAMVIGIHNWEIGLFDPRAGDDLWSQDQTVLISSSYAPAGKYTRVAGGYEISGRWPTSSGCDHCQWAILGQVTVDENQQPTDRMALLVPRTDYTIFDDWRVAGLTGTGSKSLVIEKAFVPDHRIHSLADYAISERGSNYLFPFSPAFSGAVSAVITGIAQGAIDLFIEQMATRRNSVGGAFANLSPYAKDRLGNAVSLVRRARSSLLYNFADLSTRYTDHHRLIPIEERVPLTLDIARVGRDCEQAVMLLFKSLGARGIFEDNPMQRVLRDTIAAANHITQNSDDTAGVLGGYLMGQPLPPLSYSRDPLPTLAAV